MDVKYIIVDEAYPIIFSPAMKHSDFLEMYPREKITSAAFCSLRVNRTEILRIRTYGRSVSLDRGQNPNDRMLLELLLKDMKGD